MMWCGILQFLSARLRRFGKNRASQSDGSSQQIVLQFKIEGSATPDSIQESIAKTLQRWDAERRAALRKGSDGSVADKDMPTINLDATNWKSILDFYSALLAALGAPKGYAKNINALLEWMLWDEREETQPPYMVRISGTSKVPRDVREEISYVKHEVPIACAEFRSRKCHSVVIRFETYP